MKRIKFFKTSQTKNKVNIESINCENYTQGKNKYASEYRFYIFKVYLTYGCVQPALIVINFLQYINRVQNHDENLSCTISYLSKSVVVRDKTQPCLYNKHRARPKFRSL